MESFKRECPGLFAKLSRALDPCTLQQLSQDYQQAGAAGGNLEVGIVREQGVSFNPRIARIVSIVLQEGGVLQDGGCNEPITLRAAIYATIPVMPDILGDDDGAIKGLINELRKDLVDATMDGRARILALAIELDSIRHLHMSALSLTEKREVLDCAARLAEYGAQAVLSAKLSKKLAHGVSMQSKKISL